MSEPFEPVYSDCWCGETHIDPWTDFWHGLLTELRIPELAEWMAKTLDPPEQPTLDCWFDFEDGHTCIAPAGHDGPHEPTPDDEIVIQLADPAEDVGEQPTTRPHCEIDGCNAPATTIVTGPSGLIEICPKCRDELVSLWGYKTDLQ